MKTCEVYSSKIRMKLSDAGWDSAAIFGVCLSVRTELALAAYGSAVQNCGTHLDIYTLSGDPSGLACNRLGPPEPSRNFLLAFTHNVYIRTPFLPYFRCTYCGTLMAKGTISLPPAKAK
jgi:hypothetical protein